MMHKILFTCTLLFTCSCTPAGVGKAPVDIERLADLVADLHLMEGLTGELATSIRDSVKQEFAKNIIADHGYRQTEFDSIMWIVRTEPEWVDELFQKVSDNMATMEAEMSRTPPKVEDLDN